MKTQALFSLAIDNQGDMDVLKQALKSNNIDLVNPRLQGWTNRSAGFPELVISVSSLAALVAAATVYLFHKTSPENAMVTLSSGDQQVTLHAGQSDHDIVEALTRFYVVLNPRDLPN